MKSFDKWYRKYINTASNPKMNPLEEAYNAGGEQPAWGTKEEWDEIFNERKSILLECNRLRKENSEWEEASIRTEQNLSYYMDYRDREWTSKIMSRKELKINQTGESVKNSYILIMHTDPEYFSELIEVHLEDGWVLVGGPFMFNGDTFCQAMSE